MNDDDGDSMCDDYACMYGDVVVTYYDDAVMYDDGYTKDDKDDCSLSPRCQLRSNPLAILLSATA